MDQKDLNTIFEGSQNAATEMERIFKEHENMETVIVNPNSWVGKELLIETKRLIELKRDVHSLISSINRLEKKVTELNHNAKK